MWNLMLTFDELETRTCDLDCYHEHWILFKYLLDETVIFGNNTRYIYNSIEVDQYELGI